MAELKLSFFGPPRLEKGGREIDIPLNKAKALLAYLMVTDKPHSRDLLATLLWPESDESSARANLRRTLYRLNQQVEDALLVTADTIGRNPAADIWVDVEAFREHVAAGLGDRDGGEIPAPERVAALEQAAALYRDDFLAGFTLRDAPEFDEWQFFQRDGLRRSLAQVLIALATAYQEEAEWEQAIAVSRRWLALDPLHEAAHRHLMQLYALAGQQAAALRQYEECVRVLAEELGVDPDAETRKLYEAIRRRQLAPTGTAAPPPPPDANVRIPHNLPAETTPFIGRERELAVLTDYLSHPHVRLITIMGPGGMGKTRLAVSAASRYLDAATQEAAAASAGIYFVPLAPLSAANQVAAAIAEAIGLSLESGAGEQRPARQQLLDYLREKRLLLILDNFEHLLDAVDLVEAILQTAPEVVMLVTSRQRLGLHGEHLLVILGLDYPEEADDTGSLARFAAIRLFVDAARRRQHDFALAEGNARDIAAVCRLVEGMPLAVELAAAWIDVLPASAIAGEIRRSLDFLESDIQNLPRRQQSMRAVFDTTWQMLAPEEQETFARLSVFRGGFTREAVQAITGASLRRLTRLSDKVLLKFDPTEDRYHVHELLRQYAAEALAQMPTAEKEVGDAHSDYYCSRLAGLAPRLKSGEQESALGTLEADADNVEQAWHWAAEQEQHASLRRAMDALGYFYQWLGRVENGQKAFEHASARLEENGRENEPGDPHLLARLLGWQAIFTYLGGDTARAWQLLHQAYPLLERAGLSGRPDPADRAFLTMQRGMVAAVMGKAETYALYERSLSLFREAGCRWETAEVLAQMGRWLHLLADFQQAEMRLQESLALRRELGDRRGIAEVLGWLSQAAVEQGRFDQAENLAREGHAIYQELGRRYGMASGLRQLGIILMWLGKNEESHRYLAQGLEYSQELGSRPLSAHLYSLNGLVLSLLGRNEEAIAQGRTGLQLFREVGDANQLGWSLWTLGWILTSCERYADARAALEESVAVYRSLADGTSEPRQLGWALSLLGYVLWRQGHSTEARQWLLEVLPISIHLRDVLPLLTALPAVALMLAEQGETERAAELHTLIWRYALPANDQGWLKQAGEALAAVTARLPGDALADARARAAKLDLQQAAESLVEELPLLGWSTT